MALAKLQTLTKEAGSLLKILNLFYDIVTRAINDDKLKSLIIPL